MAWGGRIERWLSNVYKWEKCKCFGVKMLHFFYTYYTKMTFSRCGKCKKCAVPVMKCNCMKFELPGCERFTLSLEGLKESGSILCKILYISNPFIISLMCNRHLTKANFLLFYFQVRFYHQFCTASVSKAKGNHSRNHILIILDQIPPSTQN